MEHFRSCDQLPLTALVPRLTGVHPDDAFSSVPYEKGSLLLFYLETLLGGPGTVHSPCAGWTSTQSMCWVDQVQYTQSMCAGWTGTVHSPCAGRARYSTQSMCWEDQVQYTVHVLGGPGTVHSPCVLGGQVQYTVHVVLGGPGTVHSPCAGWTRYSTQSTCWVDQVQYTVHVVNISILYMEHIQYNSS